MCQSIQHKHPKTKHRKLKNEIETQMKKIIQQNKNRKQNIETNLLYIFTFGFATTIAKHGSVIVLMCQSIQHKHPKTKHWKLKNEIKTQTKKKEYSKTKTENKTSNELVVNIYLWICKNH